MTSPGVEGAVLHQHGGDGAAAFIQAGLHHGAFGGAGGVGLEFFHLRHQQDGFQQLVEAHAGMSGHGNDDDVAAPFLGNQLVLGELLP